MGPMCRPETSVRNYNYSLCKSAEERSSRLLRGESLKFHLIFSLYFFFLWRCGPTRAMASSFLRFLDHTHTHIQRRNTVSRTPLDVWSAPSQRPQPDNTSHSQQTNIHATGGIRTHDLSRRAAADLRLRPRGHWDRHPSIYDVYFDDLHLSAFR